MKAPTYVIAHPTIGHRLEGAKCHPSGLRVADPSVLAQEEQQLGWTWKLRRATESAVRGIEHVRELGTPVVECGRVRDVCRLTVRADAAAGLRLSEPLQ